MLQGGILLLFACEYKPVLLLPNEKGEKNKPLKKKEEEESLGNFFSSFPTPVSCV